jgi:signal transduction protein with GAF and PtsI domain
MRSNVTRLLAVACCLALISAAGPVGCSSPGGKGPSLSAEAASSAQTVRDELLKGEAQLDKTIAAFSNLTNNPKADLQPQYRTFAASVDELQAAADKVASRNQSLKARAQSYFDAWSKQSAQIKNQDVRAMAAERRAAAQQALSTLSSEYAAGKTQMRGLLNDLRDAQLYLGHDLTAEGVTNAKPLAEKAAADAVVVKKQLDKVLAELQRVEEQLAPRAPGSAAPAK